ncbi:DUF7338 family protein [Stutzerimonas nitrititolerans]|uniref:DUF7338 family protein n=1 Tax=Stutzerimonas nitrititolerans TaxID=2482751 RepID=UPI0028AB344D|nr:hypothetical protein [Stutzerimonas nitrititolerans]
MNLSLALIQWALLIVARVALIVIGLPVVALAIPFRTEGVSASDGRAIVNLPRWAWMFGNDYDGLFGDKRGWWADNTPFGWPVGSFAAMWWWAAIRNPVNNLRLVPGISCPVSECLITYRGHYSVEDKPDRGGWQFVTAKRHSGSSRWYGFYFVHEWSKTRAFVIRIGYKIKPSHAGSDEPAKGMTFKLNPWKEI